jgi:choice-of-anchor B domain-containing protein
MISALLTLLPVVLPPFLPPAPVPHDDDPKILDRQPIYGGPGWRPGAPPGNSSRSTGYLSGGDSPGLQFTSNNASLLSWISGSEFFGAGGNDCWGYVSSSGREYALIGLSNGTGVVEVTSPSFPQIVAHIPGPGSLWRDIKTYQNYAYAVSEGGVGIQVIDLSGVDNGNVSLVNTITSGGSLNSHNVAIDEVSGYLYRCGGGGNGLRIYSLSNPASPSYVGQWSNRYVHDAQVVTYTSGPYSGRQIAFICGGYGNGSSQTRFEILDVTNKSNIYTRDTVFYSNAAYAHQAWLSPDRQYAYLNDELDENGTLPTTTYVMDISDLNNASLTATFTNGNRAIGHNLYTLDDRIYEANYRSGLRVFEASNPTQPTEIAWFDTWPLDDHDRFNGAWSCYPYLPSGIVLISDLEKGLFMVWIGAPLITFDYPVEPPALFHPSGTTFQVLIQESLPGILLPGSPTLYFDEGNGWQSTPLSQAGGDLYDVTFPSLTCGAGVAWYISALSNNGIQWNEPGVAPYTRRNADVAISHNVAIDDALESPAGWTVGGPADNATGGVWVHGDPPGTIAQPEDDHSASGTKCWFTGLGSDVDGGLTSLTSPSLDLSMLLDPHLSYWRWFSNDETQYVENDRFRVFISNDDGISWQLLETVGPHGSEVVGGWIHHEVRVADTLPATSTMRLRFEARDREPDHRVEAAIDDLRFFDVECDCNGNSTNDLNDIQSGVSLDCNRNGLPDECDIADGVSEDLDGNGIPDECDCSLLAYCASTPNSAGNIAQMSASGSTSLAANDLVLEVTGGMPGQFGLFFYGPDDALLSFGQGFLCVSSGAAGIQRLSPPEFLNENGSASRPLDLTQPPASGGAGQITTGSTWYFQVWYRDPLASGATFNLSNGLQVNFCP